MQYECESSNVIAKKSNELIETKYCMNLSGVYKLLVVMYITATIDGGLMRKLCSPYFYNRCPNIEFSFNHVVGGWYILVSLVRG